MAALPQFQSSDTASESLPPVGGCGTTCGAGLEKVYPSTAVRFGVMNQIGEFKYKSGTVFKCGAKVVVQSDRGIELGQQVSLSCTGCDKHVSRDQIKQYIANSGPEFYRLNSGRILREATEQDVDEHERLNSHVDQEIEDCALVAAQLDLDMRVITAEHLLGGERIVFFFRSDTRVDFRQLVRELAERYQTRIEMRQVGARDEARLVADYEICGRECCCKNFLKKLRPVGMKMAKLQKSTLDPSKVSGRCGRLRCCLRYEHEGYESLAAKLPRVGARVGTEFGPATVIDRQILTQLLLVRNDENRQMTIPLEELCPVEEAERAVAARTAQLESQRRAEEEQRQAGRGRPRRRREGAQRSEAPPGRDDRKKPPASDVGPPPQATDATAPSPETAPGSGEEPAQPKRRRRRRRGGRGRSSGPDGGGSSAPPDTGGG